MSVSVQRLSKSAWNKKKQRSKDSNWYLCQSAIENSNYRWIQKNVWISFLLPTWKPSKSDYRNRRKPASVDILNGGLFRRVFFSLSLSRCFLVDFLLVSWPISLTYKQQPQMLPNWTKWERIVHFSRFCVVVFIWNCFSFSLSVSLTLYFYCKMLY